MPTWAPDREALCAILRGEFLISGFRNAWLRKYLPGYTSAQMSNIIKRLRLHGMIKQAGRSYKYCLTELGKDAVATGLKLHELVVIPALAESLAA